MRRRARTVDVVVVAVAVTLSLALAACSSSSKSANAPSTQTKTTHAASTAGKTDLCGLLTDDEVTGVIGAHTKGATGILTGAEYGPDSCQWKSTNTKSSDPDSLEVAVLSGATADSARAEAARAPALDSFGHSAHYNESYSRLWFECGSGRYCQVRVATGSVTTHSGDTREDAAEKLARQVLSRV